MRIKLILIFRVSIYHLYKIGIEDRHQNQVSDRNYLNEWKYSVKSEKNNTFYFSLSFPVFLFAMAIHQNIHNFF